MSLIIMSKKVREFEMPTPTTQFSGHFKLEVINPSTGKVKRSLEFDNLILNNGLNRFTSAVSTNTRCLDRVCIGTGTVVPDVNQTALAAFSASTDVSSTNIQSGATAIVGQEYSYSNIRMRFAAGTLNGNYTEVGIGWANDQLFSRALIVDGLGNPTSITVLSDEALDVTYTLRMYIPQSDTITSVTITGVGTNIPLTIRAALVRVNNSGGGGGTVSNRPWNNTSAGWAFTNNSTIGLIGTGFGGDYFNISAGSWYGSGPGFCAPTTRTTLDTLTSTSYTSAGAPSLNTDVTNSTEAYVSNNFYKNTTVVFGLNAYNSTYRHFVAGFTSMGAYQYLLGTPITKTASQILTLNFRCSWARRTI